MSSNDSKPQPGPSSRGGRGRGTHNNANRPAKKFGITGEGIKPKYLHQFGFPATVPRNESILRDSIFGSKSDTREVKPNIDVNVNCGSFFQVVKETWDNMNKTLPSPSDELCQETFVYYSHCMFALRQIELKEIKQQPLTKPEKEVKQVVKEEAFSVPQPIYVYLSSLGRITSVSGQHLRPNLMDLPAEEFGDLAGVFGKINRYTHNAYEEIPTTGVQARALQQALSEAPPGTLPDYAILPDGTIPTENLVGSHTLSRCSEEMKNFVRAIGITEDEFPETVRNTRFNLPLLIKVSSALNYYKSCKMQQISIGKFGASGSINQMVTSLPIDLVGDQLCNDAVNIGFNPFNATPGIFGSGVVFGFQRIKISTPNLNLTIGSRSWCCVTVNLPAAITITQLIPW